MLFLSLLFVLISAYTLIRGKLFHGFLMEHADWEVKIKRGDEKEFPKEMLVKSGMVGIFAMVMFIIEVLFVVSALKVDPYLFPTLFFIVITFLNTVSSANSKNKKDLATEVGRVKYLTKVYKKRTFKGTILSLINFTYFTYLFLVVLEVIK